MNCHLPNEVTVVLAQAESNMGHVNQSWFSSNTDEWGTPIKVFEELNKEFHFTLDPCASNLNHKCNNYYTIDTDGLAQNWGGKFVLSTLRILK